MSIVYTILLVAVINLLLSVFVKKSNSLFCGIVGFSAPPKTHFNLNKLKVLFYINSLERGKDSVGFYSPSNGLKKVGKAYADIITEEGNIIDTVTPDNVLIGHVRAATSGLKTEKNSHPWEYKNIVGLHNGTLRDYIAPEHSIGKKYGFTYSDYDVDSQILLKALDKDFDTLDKNLLPALEHYEGAAALLMYNKERGTIFACHDTERPLFYGYIGKAMYISSIAHTLQIIGCTRVKAFDICTVYEIKEGVIINKFKYTPQSRIEKKSSTSSKSSGQILLDLIDTAKGTTSQGMSAFLKWDDKLKAAVATSFYPATGLPFTGCHTFYDFNSELFQGFNVRLRNQDSKIEVYDEYTKKMVEFDGRYDYFTVVNSEMAYTGQSCTVFSHRHNREFELKAHLLDPTRIIPQVGMYVKFVSKVTFNGSKKVFAVKGEVLKVTAFWPNLGTFECTTLDGKLSGTVLPDAFVIANSGEVITESYDSNTSLFNALCDIQPDILDILDDAEIIAPSCDVEKTPKLVNPTEVIIEEEEFPGETLTVDCEKFDDYILNISDSVDSIVDTIENDVDSAKTELKELQLHIKSFDFKEIIN